MRSRNRMRALLERHTPLVRYYVLLTSFLFRKMFLFSLQYKTKSGLSQISNQRYNIVEQEGKKKELNSRLKPVSLGGGTSMPHSGPGDPREFVYALGQSQSLNTPVTFCNLV